MSAADLILLLGERHAIYSLACPRDFRDGGCGKSRVWGAKVKKALDELALPGVKHSLDGGTLTLKGDSAVDVDKVKAAIEALGFGVKMDEA